MRTVGKETEDRIRAYAEFLAILELFTRPFREAFKSGEMTGCHDNNSITCLEVGNVAADAVNDAGAFERGSGVSSLDLAGVDEDILSRDTQDQQMTNQDQNRRHRSAEYTLALSPIDLTSTSTDPAFSSCSPLVSGLNAKVSSCPTL